MYANFVFWGIVDLIIALYADILSGGAYRLVVGYIFAVVGAVRWLFVILAAPLLAVVVIALCAKTNPCPQVRITRGSIEAA